MRYMRHRLRTALAVLGALAVNLCRVSYFLTKKSSMRPFKPYYRPRGGRLETQAKHFIV